jgi:cyclase
MLKQRILPIVLLTGYNVVKSVQFSSFRTLGNPITVCRVYETRGVDELLLLDIRATAEDRGPNLDIVRDISSECFMPLTVGGGISSLEQARQVVRNGADKVAVNSGAIARPQLISEIARELGRQCCVVSIDVRRQQDGQYRVYSRAGRDDTRMGPVGWAKRAEELGAGEILVNSIDQDGTMRGYDLDLVSSVAASVKIPVIAAGGAGSPRHFVEVFRQGGAAAAAAASIFHFTSFTPRIVKETLRDHNIPVRL